MILMTWNVQWCRGCDGRVDPARIAAEARRFADFDLLCLQEVAAHFPDLEGSAGEDQFRMLREALPDYAGFEAPAVDVLDPAGGRRQFGNMMFSRLPVLQAFRQLLPWPSDPGVPSMPRSLLELLVQTPQGPLRVGTTHLEYYSASQRAAQVEALRALQAEAAGRAAAGPAGGSGPFRDAPGTVSAVLAGDFNLRPEDPLYERMQAPLAMGVPAYADAWRVCYGNRVHEPTLGVFDKVQWPDPAFPCDFIFVSEDLAPRVRSVRVEATSRASDHQPVVLELQC
jgi:endonuclease/exonuclease/phosphatase family metal-dependent hydrolase